MAEEDKCDCLSEVGLEGSIEYIFKTIDNPEGYIDS
jgi:hypothetical protein